MNNPYNGQDRYTWWKTSTPCTKRGKKWTHPRLGWPVWSPREKNETAGATSSPSRCPTWLSLASLFLFLFFLFFIFYFFLSAKIHFSWPDPIPLFIILAHTLFTIQTFVYSYVISSGVYMLKRYSQCGYPTEYKNVLLITLVTIAMYYMSPRRDSHLITHVPDVSCLCLVCVDYSFNPAISLYFISLYLEHIPTFDANAALSQPVPQGRNCNAKSQKM